MRDILYMKAMMEEVCVMPLFERIRKESPQMQEI